MASFVTAVDHDRFPRLGLYVSFAWLLCACQTFGASPEGPFSFVNDIEPVLTKAGCNGGVCHAKAGGGQNGFQLSLLGFEPEYDYDSVVKDARGRRVFPAAPERSLLLMKASGQTPHGGGMRLAPDSDGYRLLHEWITQGAPYGDGSEPDLVSVSVAPDRGMVPTGSEQQLTATATYSDGSTRDVTALALYESNAEAMADVSSSGLVHVKDVPGNVAVMVRYQGKVAVFTAAVPLGATVDNLPEARNFIDEHVFANLREIGIPPSPVCDDATFVRRVSLDIAGRLPTREEATAFLESTEAGKRDQLIEKLLQSPGYADFFANK
ncbi:MAG: DUF1549 domain-containing protein, partial [Planctomycetaceae bacterium]|nr:DUF1549 domain-containing protein [Planctomycetaceae bacterium]